MIWWCMSEGRCDIITFIFLLPKCMLVQVKLLINILSETKYTMHLFQLFPLCVCRLLPTRYWCCWKTAIRLNNTRQQLCHMYILYIYYLHIICILYIYDYTCVAVACGARLTCSVFMVYRLLLSMALVARASI